MKTRASAARVSKAPLTVLKTACLPSIDGRGRPPSIESRPKYSAQICGRPPTFAKMAVMLAVMKDLDPSVLATTASSTSAGNGADLIDPHLDSDPGLTVTNQLRQAAPPRRRRGPGDAFRSASI